MGRCDQGKETDQRSNRKKDFSLKRVTVWLVGKRCDVHYRAVGEAEGFTVGFGVGLTVAADEATEAERLLGSPM